MNEDRTTRAGDEIHAIAAARRCPSEARILAMIPGGFSVRRRSAEGSGVACSTALVALRPRLQHAMQLEQFRSRIRVVQDDGHVQGCIADDRVGWNLAEIKSDQTAQTFERSGR